MIGRAGQLAKDKVYDMLMVRYNAAHPGAEQDIFPREPPVYRPHFVHRDPMAKAAQASPGVADCYRFCLARRGRHILDGREECGTAESNLRGLEKGPMVGEEMDTMRAFGRAVRG